MLNERLHASIEDALHDTVHYSVDPKTGRVLTVREIATDINVPAGRLQDAADPQRDQPPHMSWIVPLVKRTRNYSIVRFICHAVGGVFILLPDAGHASAIGFVRVIGNVMKEVADVVKVATDAIDGDGKVDAKEKASLLQQIAEARDALTVAEELVKALPADGEPRTRRSSR